MTDFTTDQSSAPGLFGGLLTQASSPVGMGLLSAAFSGLAGARRGQFWNNLGRAGRDGLLGYSMAQEREQQLAQQRKQGQMFDLQLKQAQQGQQDQTDLRTLAQQYYKAPTMTLDQVNTAPGQLGPTNARADLIPNTMPTFDTAGFLNAYMAKDPLKAMQLRASLAKESQFDKFKPENYTAASVAEAMRTNDYSKLVRLERLHFGDSGGSIVGLNPYTGKEVSSVEKTGNPFSDLVTRAPDGKLIPNAQVVGARASISKAGAPSVRVINDISTGKSIADQIGPMMKDSYTGAQGAVQTATAADQVLRAIQAGNLVTGPLAGQRIKGLQIGEAIGIGGRDATERLNNTRSAIQGLAQMTLQGRKQMSGQGAVTDSESKLAERAMSGDIEMTATELRTLASAAKRAAQWTYSQHQTQLKNMRGRPDLAGMADFYTTAPFPGNSGPVGDINFEDLK